MADFEKNLTRLEQLTTEIKKNDISLEDALKNFEEGIKLARGMEKEIERIEGKIQQLMNEPIIEEKTKKVSNSPELDLFENVGDSGSSGVPQEGLRQ